MLRRLVHYLILVSALPICSLQSQLSKEWSSQFNGTAAANDEVDATALDSHGNFYVAGLSSGAAGYTAVLIKYDSSGTTAWTTPLTGPGDMNDRPVTLSIGVQGDLFMLCSGDNPPTQGVIKTVKFNASGGVEWRKTLDKGSNTFAYAGEMGLDDSENVYICGYEGGAGADSGIVAKYASEGSLRWLRSISLPNQLSCRAERLRTDGSGNVYVLGNYTHSLLGSMPYLAKFDPGGTMTWSATYDVGLPSGRTFTSFGVVQDGGTLVYGTIDDSLGTGALILRYDGQGGLLWHTIYHDLGGDLTLFQDLAIDGDRNSYLTGFAQVSDAVINEIITISLDTAGHVRWEGRYDGPFNGNQQSNAIALEQGGNVYVSGAVSDSLSGDNAFLLKYGSGGSQEWVRVSKEPAEGYSEGKTVNVVSGSRIYLCANSLGPYTGYDILTISYDAAGTELWRNRYNTNTGAYDNPFSSTVDDSGNVILTGYSYTGSTLLSSVMRTVKFGADGSVRWSAAYPDSASQVNEGEVVIHDAAGNIYVAGTLYSWSPFASGPKGLVTIKYSPAGALLWAKVFTPPGGGGDDRAVAMSLDDSGNVIVAATAKWDSLAKFSTWTDFTVLKYSSAGVLRWTGRYDFNGTQEGVTGMALDDSANVYVTGFSQGGNGQYDYATVKFDRSTGSLLWARRFDGLIGGEDYPRGIAIDNAGHVYVTGSSFDSAAIRSALTIKYDRAGEVLWVRRFLIDSLNHYEQDQAWGIILDQQQNPIIGVNKPANPSGSLFVKYNPDGSLQWRSAFSPFTFGNMIRDDGGNVFATAYGSFHHPAVMKLTGLGAQAWTFVDTSLTGSGFLIPGFDKSGNLSLSFDAKTVGTDQDFGAAKYALGPDGVHKEPAGVPALFRLYDAYPNPFNPRTRIEYALPSRQHVSLRVFNILGERVAELVNETKDAGLHHADFDASGLATGIYFYRLKAGPFIAAKKIMFMK